jgi:GTP:adenosylcobinamide-phosphate guanylyltransferase
VNSGENWTAIILAGERPGEDGFAAAHGVAAKALIPVAGEPMLGRVVRAVLAAPSIRKIVLLAQNPQALLSAELAWIGTEPRVTTAASNDSISNSIKEVAGGEAAPFPALVVTADHALLEPRMVESFIAGSDGVDAAFAIVERRVVEADYPETKRTWIRFSDGDYTGANLFAFRTAASHRALDVWSNVEQDRKRAMRLLMFFGPGLALRALTRTISLDAALAKAARKAGLTVRAVRLPFARAAIDVDKPADLELVEAVLADPPDRFVSVLPPD